VAYFFWATLWMSFIFAQFLLIALSLLVRFLSYMITSAICVSRIVIVNVISYTTIILWTLYTFRGLIVFKRRHFDGMDLAHPVYTMDLSCIMCVHAYAWGTNYYRKSVHYRNILFSTRQCGLSGHTRPAMRQLLPRKTTNNNEMTNIRNQLLRLSLSDAYNAHCQKCLHFHNRTVCNLHVSTFAHTHTHTHTHGSLW